MSEIYFIDGYNLLHYSQDWKDLARNDLEVARQALVRHVAQWCAASGKRARIVFDGAGLQTERSSDAIVQAGVEVLYSSKRTSADAVIERGVYEAARHDTVVVVTGDRGIRDLCVGMGALTLSPDSFLTMLDETASEVSGRLKSRRARGRFGPLEHHLSPEEKSHLEDVRRKLDAKE